MRLALDPGNGQTAAALHASKGPLDHRTPSKATGVRRHLLPGRVPMKPKFQSLSPADRATVALWSRRVLIAWGIIVGSLIAFALLTQPERGMAQNDKAQPHAQSASHELRGQQ